MRDQMNKMIGEVTQMWTKQERHHPNQVVPSIPKEPTPLAQVMVIVAVNIYTIWS